MRNMRDIKIFLLQLRNKSIIFLLHLGQRGMRCGIIKMDYKKD